MSAPRNDSRYVEDSRVAFAMYCDENGLSLDEGRALAERVGEELEASADDRAMYLPPAAAPNRGDAE